MSTELAVFDEGVSGEVMDEIMAEAEGLTGNFFAPMDGTFLDVLLADYSAQLADITQIAEFAARDGYKAALSHFLTANDTDRRLSLSVERLFDLAPAVKALDAFFWQRMLNHTDIYDAMPQKRRDQWNEMIRTPQGIKARQLSDFELGRGAVQKEWELSPIPPFEEATVRETMRDLLASRMKFLAERIDGIFRGLSRSHVTNVPEGFAKRFIIEYAFDKRFGSINHGVSGLVHDLRGVIARFEGREESKLNRTYAILERSRKRYTGQWIELDGGALKIRCYQVGTVHIEVHPEVAWKLNSVLATLHPAAIPAKRRTRQPRGKNVRLIDRMLAAEVVDAIDCAKRESIGGGKVVIRTGWTTNKAISAEVQEVMEMIGGVKTAAGNYEFDYLVDEVLDEIVMRGTIPHRKSHQFYPTPESLALYAVNLAEISEGHSCLEPSAGQGALAQFMPSHTTLVEVSRLQASILEAKGFTQVVNCDFIEFAQKLQQTPTRFDRIVMNPPFDQGRYAAHIEQAASLLAAGGRLVAIAPSGAMGKTIVQGKKHTYHGPFHDAFDKTGVSVIMVVIE